MGMVMGSRERFDGDILWHSMVCDNYNKHVM